MTQSGIYDRIATELNRNGNEGNKVLRDDFRELPGAARQHKAEESLIPELVL